MREAIVLIAIILTVSAIGIYWSDSAEADACTVHFDYQPKGDYYTPATIGQPLLRENIQFLIDMGSWHLENGDPWDPDAPITGDTLIIIDDRPEPIPIPTAPEETPAPEIIPGPSPAPSSSEENQNIGLDYLKMYAPFIVLFGVVVVAILFTFKRK